MNYYLQQVLLSVYLLKLATVLVDIFYAQNQIMLIFTHLQQPLNQDYITIMELNIIMLMMRLGLNII